MSEWTHADALTFKGVDAIEVAGIDSKSGRIDDDAEPWFWSVFVHIPFLGAIDVADRRTIDGARDYAATLATHYGVPVYDFA